jgi:predicted transcriptional regulator
MKPEISSDTLSLPPALLAEVKALAEREHRPAFDILREILEHGLANRREWQERAETERQRAREFGIHDPVDDEPMADEYRQIVREQIAQGLSSLHEGRFTDGETFMAMMDAELAELERQRR